jgi:hypothetical protein
MKSRGSAWELQKRRLIKVFGRFAAVDTNIAAAAARIAGRESKKTARQNSNVCFQLRKPASVKKRAFLLYISKSVTDLDYIEHYGRGGFAFCAN